MEKLGTVEQNERWLFDEKIKASETELGNPCQLTGKSVGATNQAWKLYVNKGQPSFIPIVFFYFSKCDSELHRKALKGIRHKWIKYKVLSTTNQKFSAVIMAPWFFSVSVEQ